MDKRGWANPDNYLGHNILTVAHPVMPLKREAFQHSETQPLVSLLFR